jgi:alpha-glucosidase
VEPRGAPRVRAHPALLVRERRRGVPHDVAHAIFKDRKLRDEPVVPGGGIQREYSMFRPETHELLREWHRLARSYDPPRLLLGEVYSLEVEQWARYFGENSDQLDLAFAFMLAHSNLEADEMRGVVARVEAALPLEAWPCWGGSNHDIGRLATRWAGGDDARTRCALMLLLTLRGTPCLYYGDELALTSGEVPTERIVDCATPSRDPGRTPMPWTPDGGWHEPWLPLSDTIGNVEAQRADPGSTLHFTRDLITLRRQLTDLRRGGYAELPAPAGCWMWRRGDEVVVALNLGAESVQIEGITGSIALSTNRGRDGESATERLTLGASEGVVVLRSGVA